MQDELPAPTAQKQSHGFQKGQSGKNPAGRKPSSKNKATMMAERLMEKDIKGVTNVVVAAALDGDLQACRIIMDRVAPAAKTRKVSFPMAEIEFSPTSPKAGSQRPEARPQGDVQAIGDERDKDVRLTARRNASA